MTAQAQRTAAINIRALPAQKQLIDSACNYAHKKITEFVLDAACREAEHILCDRRYFILDENAFNAFEAALDAPLSANKAVQQLLQKKSPWET
jgi:uncharacterized protein (DUF1778 family)